MSKARNAPNICNSVLWRYQEGTEMKSYCESLIDIYYTAPTYKVCTLSPRYTFDSYVVAGKHVQHHT